jgi:hypothetical protein
MLLLFGFKACVTVLFSAVYFVISPCSNQEYPHAENLKLRLPRLFYIP